MSIDLTILGIVFAVILLIIVFSAIILYLAFRIKETFRDEKRRGIRIVKITFMIGTLFLAGGILYFFAGTLTPPLPTPTPNPSNNGTEWESLTLTVSYPPRVRTRSDFTLSFTIVNPNEEAAHSVNIQASYLFESFTVVSSTHQLLGNVIQIGEVPPGTTISSLELTSPTKPGEIQDTIILTFKEMTDPINQEISISVTGGQ